MQQVRLFKGIESELHAMEDEMNQWIRDSGAKIISITGNIAPQTGNTQPAGNFSASDVLVVVLYETNNE